MCRVEVCLTIITHDSAFEQAVDTSFKASLIKGGENPIQLICHRFCEASLIKGGENPIQLFCRRCAKGLCEAALIKGGVNPIQLFCRRCAKGLGQYLLIRSFMDLVQLVCRRWTKDLRKDLLINRPAECTQYHQESAFCIGERLVIGAQYAVDALTMRVSLY